MCEKHWPHYGDLSSGAICQAGRYRLPFDAECRRTHSARKSYAVELMRRYGDIERVRRSLNHSSAAVTVLYACADTIVKRRGRRRRSW